MTGGITSYWYYEASREQGFLGQAAVIRLSRDSAACHLRVYNAFFSCLFSAYQLQAPPSRNVSRLAHIYGNQKQDVIIPGSLSGGSQMLGKAYEGAVGRLESQLSGMQRLRLF